jgi:polyferredoxin
MLFGLTTRATIDLNVLRDRNPTFVRLSDGSIRNAYTVKVMNRVNARRTLALAIEGPRGFSAKIVGIEDATLPTRIEVEGDRLRTLRVLLTVPGEALAEASLPVTFRMSDAASGETRSTDSVFLSDGGGS